MLKCRAGLIPLLSATLLVVGVSSCKKNHPPDAPAVPTGPAYCFKEMTYTFSASATDPDDDSVAARFDWGDSTMSEWSGWSTSGRAITLTHAWSDTGTYEVRAQGRDQRLVESDWSSGLAVRVALHRPPDTPAAPSGPDTGIQDSSCTFATAASHPDGFSVAIRFAWGDGDTSDWSAFVASEESVRMNHTWSVPGTWAVTAQAKDTGNALSQWSPPHDITIQLDTLKWRFKAAGSTKSSPAIGPDGTLYFGSYDSCLYAVSRQCILSWRFHTGGVVWVSPAVAADGTVYFGSDDGYLYALNPNGTLKWSQQVGAYVDESPAIGSDGSVYVGSADRKLYAFSADGTPKWQYQTQREIACSPAVATDGTVYIGSTDGFVHAVNPDGSAKWQCSVIGWPTSTAIAADGTVYVGTRFSDFYAINADGTVKWQYPLSADIRSEPAIGTDGTIYFGSQDNYLYALNPDGTIKWKYQTDGPIWSTPAVAADGTLYLGSDDAYLHAVNSDGTLKWKYSTEGSIQTCPAIGPDGTIYFCSYDGYLYALRGTSPLADSPWPKSQHDLRNTGRFGGGR